jgi:sulfate adenylyltransferase subunit 1 (EFTu-like GTPase family)
VTVPICAREGDNIATRSARMPWYEGPVLLDYLETVSVAPPSDTSRGFRFPVQWVNRPSLDFRGYAGTIASGVVHAHQPVIVLPSRQRSRIASIVTADGLLETASAGQAVTLTLANEVDVSRGDTIVPADDPLAAGTDVTARVLWMVDEPLTVGQSLVVKLGSATANARVAGLHHAIDIHSFSPRPATALALNEIGVADLVFDKPLVTAAYSVDRELGAFVLIDRVTNQTVALGVIEQRSHSADTKGIAALPAWRGTMLRVVGPAGSRERWQFWQTVVSRLLVAGVLALVVVALSRNAMLAALVGLAELVLRPILGRLVKSAWQRWFLPPPQTYEWAREFDRTIPL